MDGCCGCGPGTAYFGSVDGAVPVPGPVPGDTGRRIAVQALLRTDTGDRPGEPLLSVDDGRLSWLEVAWWSDDKVTLAEAARRSNAAGPNAARPERHRAGWLKSTS